MTEQIMAGYTFEAGGKKVAVYPGNTPDRPAIYLNTLKDDGAQLCRMLRGAGNSDVALVTISGLSWNCDMAPWEAPAVFRNAKPCTGGADAYLELLTTEIVPKAEALVRKSFLQKNCPQGTLSQSRIPWRGIAGYSLAGLFAVYALYRTELFSRAASMSGSLWFPGFQEYAVSHAMKADPEHMYFSLGDRECRTRHPLLKTVQERTEALTTFYAQKGIDTVFQFNPGNHYQDTEKRTVAGIAWLAGR